MRTLRLCLAGGLGLLLLGVLPLAAVAQEEASSATYVTGRIISDSGWSAPESATSDGDIGHSFGMQAEREVEWSDPRLPSTMTTVMNLNDYPAAMTWAQVHRLAGPDGTWTATERGFYGPNGSNGLMVWTGEGPYEGLSATLVGTVTESGEVLYEGYIFEGGLPALPDPIEPMPAE